MSLYAIADLHLANTVPDKSMDVFGGQWTDHQRKIEENWRGMVTDQDTVLIPGDISWAMKLEEAIADLSWIHSLPGKKVLIRGNHDFWWGSIGKVRRMLPETISAIQNDCVEFDDYVVTGTRGWITPDNAAFTREDEKIYARELVRLRLGLEDAKKRNKPIVLMMHYPPYSEKGFENEFIEMIEEYKVGKVCYGHLHGKSVNKGFSGTRNNVEYILASSDALQFKPIFIQ